MKKRKVDRLSDFKRMSGRKPQRKNVGDISELTRKRSVGIGLLNLQGKSEKGVEDLKRMVEMKDLQIMCLVETHVRKEDKDGIEIPGFNSHQCLREGNEKRGGGLAILTRRGGIVFSRYQPSVKALELAYVAKERMWVTYSCQQEKTAVCCIYLACANKENSHVAWNKGILDVVRDEIFQLRGGVTEYWSKAI